MKATILLVLALALSPLLAPSAFAQNDQKSTPAGLVDALNGVFGKQTDNRAVHAKGIVLEGKFTPSPEAAALSKAPHLQGTAVPVTVRFSDFAGVPAIPDSDPNASPRGMAVKFHLPDGSDTNIVTHSYNGFPTATADEFQQLLIALAASGPDAPKPTPLEKFFETHPIAKTFLTAEKPAPVSFGTLPYFGVNSFKFTDTPRVMSRMCATVWSLRPAHNISPRISLPPPVPIISSRKLANAWETDRSASSTSRK
jgi:catalase